MNNKFICAEEVAQELSVSKPYAYKLIKRLNDELKEKGFITISGRVNRQYFNERLYGSVLKKLHSYQQEGRQQPKRSAKKKSKDMER